jgi:transketolase
MPFPHHLANAIRFLSIDAVEKAQSGHPGMPLGMADIATALWTKHLKHNPNNPYWFNRDRFVLSNGHGSMLLYALLHLSGYGVTIEDLQSFRKLHSKTPGHPEYQETPGVETTTGPLGQGLANAVGMAIAEALLGKRFNQSDITLVDHHTYAFVGDGCLMEGISHEVCSLAGTLGLSKLIVFYDDNGISIDGNVKQWFNDDTALRFKAYHWNVIEAVNGHDIDAVSQAIAKAKEETSRPTLIICKTHIGYGSPVSDSEKSHGSPLGAAGILKTREFFNWPYAPFEIPETIYHAWSHQVQGQHDENAWLALCETYQHRYPTEYNLFLRQINGDLPDNWPEITATLYQSSLTIQTPMATRKASQHCLEILCQTMPELLGGSADLTGSNNTDYSETKIIQKDDFSGNAIGYGVREFGMAAIMNGLAVHGGFIPYGGTFLVFSDYARNAMRLSALMKQRVIYVLTHDSIGLGEDGPTHQPVEQASTLRMIPNMTVWRPADLLETSVAWTDAIRHHTGPSCLLLSRQNLPALHTDLSTIQAIERGGYILKDFGDNPDIILIATGSEVQLALNVATTLSQDNKMIRVVSMPCVERFLQQDIDYQHHVLPPKIRARLAIEAGSTASWYRFVGLEGRVLGLDHFGVSAPAKDAYNYFQLTEEHIINIILKELNP